MKRGRGIGHEIGVLGVEKGRVIHAVRVFVYKDPNIRGALYLIQFCVVLIYRIPWSLLRIALANADV